MIYAETKTNAYNPTTIPPEWHGWINYVNDLPPTTVRVVGAGLGNQWRSEGSRAVWGH